MSKARQILDMVEAVDLDKLFKEVSKKTQVKNVKQLFSWTTPREFELIYKAAEKKVKAGKLSDWEALEQFMDNNYSSSDYNK